MNKTYQYGLLKQTQLYQPSTSHPDPDYKSEKWHEAIDKLMANRYSFMSETFSEDGYLFRGMSSGLLQALKKRQFGHFESSNELALVEQVMNVYFFTHELSDALTVARLFEQNNNDDSAIIIIPAKLFTEALIRYEAAMLAIGDIGFVFRYPFLCFPINLADVKFILYKKNSLELNQFSTSIREKLIGFNEQDRQNSEEEILSFLAKENIQAAKIEKTQIYPRIER